MRFLLWFKKPKVVFLSPAYTAYGYVKAFKENGVKVVEVQHGVILKEHFGYNVYKKFDRDYFVDYLLTFGEQEMDTFKYTNGISYNNIVPVGNYYLDYISDNFKPDKKLNEILHKYKKSFVVSLQEIDKTKSLVSNIIESAKQNPDCIFIFKPRKKSIIDYGVEYDKLENVIFIEEIDIYQLIMQTDFHITVYSTCALEAPALGKKNILFNINNLSKSIFETTLTNQITTVFVDNLDEFNKLIKNLNVQNRKEILNAHGSVMKSGYKSNIDTFIKGL